MMMQSICPCGAGRQEWIASVRWGAGRTSAFAAGRSEHAAHCRRILLTFCSHNGQGPDSLAGIGSLTCC